MIKVTRPRPRPGPIQAVPVAYPIIMRWEGEHENQGWAIVLFTEPKKGILLASSSGDAGRFSEVWVETGWTPHNEPFTIQNEI